MELHGLDTADSVFFYEQDFYMLSNFSSFNVELCDIVFSTVEHAYHWLKFAFKEGGEPTKSAFHLSITRLIREARSAHEAFQIAQRYKAYRRGDWDVVKQVCMISLLELKVTQHEYVKRKLLATGDRTLVENSLRDDIWGWGPNRDGQNLLGKCWMHVRKALREYPDSFTPEAFLN